MLLVYLRRVAQSMEHPLQSQFSGQRERTRTVLVFILIQLSSLILIHSAVKQDKKNSVS